jgi:hypothetical protein
MRNEIGRILVWIGAVLLAIGVFLPLVSAPYVGAVTFLTSGDSPRAIMFATAILAFILALVGWTRHALWAGIAALAVIGYGYWHLQDRIGRFEEKFGDGLVGRFVRRGTDQIQLEGGWVIIVLGGLLILAGGTLAWRWTPRPLPPVSRRVMVVVGAVLVAVGLFLPLIQVPRVGLVGDILGSHVPRIVLVVMAAAALVLTLLDWTRHALWPGLVGATALGFSYYQVLANIGRVQASIEGVGDRLGDDLLGRIAGKAVDALQDRLGGDLLGKAANSVTELIQLQWGWAVLVIGTVLILIGSGLAWRKAAVAAATRPDQGSGDVSQVSGGEPRQ